MSRSPWNILYWEERLPEILMNVGRAAGDCRWGHGGRTNLDQPASYAMAATLDELAMLAMERNPEAFLTILPDTVALVASTNCGSVSAAYLPGADTFTIMAVCTTNDAHTWLVIFAARTSLLTPTVTNEIVRPSTPFSSRLLSYRLSLAAVRP